MEADDPEAPQQVQQVRVVGIAEEGLRVGPDHINVQPRHHRDLIVAADHGEDRGDVRVGECRVDVTGPLGRGCTEHTGGRILHRHQAQLFPQAPQALFVQRGEELWQAG